MDDQSASQEPAPEASGNGPEQRTHEGLLQALRNLAGRGNALLRFQAPAHVNDVRRLLPDDATSAVFAPALLAVIKHVHRVCVQGDYVYVEPASNPGYFSSMMMGRSRSVSESHILDRFPYVEVTKWAEEFRDESPVISAVYMLANDPLAPRVRVSFEIAWVDAVDGTSNLMYVVTGIGDEEAPDPQGS